MTNGDLKRFYGNKPQVGPNDFVRVGVDGKIPSELIPTVSGVHLISEEDASVEGLIIPKLTVAQVEIAYDAIKNGKSVIITNSEEELHSEIIFADGSTQKPSVVAIQYWVAFIDYQIVNNDVVITVHKINETSSDVINVRSSGYKTLDDSQHTAVPELTAAQVQSIYNNIVAHKIVYVQDDLGDNSTLITQKVLVGEKITIFCTYLSRLALTYTIDGDDVLITYKEF